MALHIHTSPPKDNSALHSQDSPEWYTPSYIVAMARTVMGSIDLDPASHAEANAWIQATRFYTEQDNGLVLPWDADNIFINPPGGLVAEFWKKFLSEFFVQNFKQLIWIGYSLEQFQTLQSVAGTHPLDFTVCIPRKRIPFVENEAKKVQRMERLLKMGKKPNEKSQPSHGNYIMYVGNDKASFTKVFSALGLIYGV